MGKEYYQVYIDFNEKKATAYSCRFEGDIEESFFAKKEDDFIRLNNVRWFDDETSNVIKLEEYQKMERFRDFIYVKKGRIIAVYPHSRDSIFYKIE